MEDKPSDEDIISLWRMTNPSEVQNCVMTFDRCKDGIVLEYPTRELRMLVELIMERSKINSEGK